MLTIRKSLIDSLHSNNKKSYSVGTGVGFSSFFYNNRWKEFLSCN